MNFTVLIASSPKTLRAAAPTHTVEAEYGLEVVEGSVATLAHHGPRSENRCPCLGHNWKLGDGAVIGISHLDLDTLGGVMRILGKKGVDSPEPLLWQIAAKVDIMGVHKLGEIITELHREMMGYYDDWQFIENPGLDLAIGQLNAWWAWSEAHRLTAPRDGSVMNATPEVAEAIRIVRLLLEGSDEEYRQLMEAGQVWLAAKEALHKESFILSAKVWGRTVVLRQNDSFVNHLYNTTDGVVADAIVAFNTRTKGITVSLADPIEGFSCCNFMQQEFGPLAGGHAGIAGTPRGEEFSLARARELVEELLQRLPTPTR